MQPKDLIEELQARGLVQQCSNLESLKKPQCFYLGIDPTAASMHCGHLLPVILAKRLALAGHQPLLLVGSGTAKIGDPSGKSEMRQMLSVEEIDANAAKIRKQLEYVFRDSQGVMKQPIWLDNSTWLDSLNYIEFLRDIGRHFSVNRMLSFESSKQRLERGLSFIEFNYQLLQSYDYLKLFQDHGCLLQIGGDDQWGNMVAGIDLIRRYSFAQDAEEAQERLQGKQEAEAGFPQALTVPLIMTSSGKKMGKTEQGAVFIDAELTSPFDFFQYWRNCSDEDVEKFLLLFTFVPVAEIRNLCCEGGAALNKAKEVLAYQMCFTVHGEAEADRALGAAFGIAVAKTNFGLAAAYVDLAENANKATAEEAARVAAGGAPMAAPVGMAGFGNFLAQMLGKELEATRLEQGIDVVSLFVEAGLCSSRNEARRLIQGGGASINGQKILEPEQLITKAALVEKHLILKAGKKRFFRFTLA